MDKEMKGNKKKYHINLSFSNATLPPFKDILVIGNNCPQGKFGIAKSFNLLLPDEFELIETNINDKIDGLLINKKLLAKIDIEKLIAILEKNVFPYILPGEIIKVDMDLKVVFESIELEG